jgi:hypothetical protein
MHVSRCVFEVCPDGQSNILRSESEEYQQPFTSPTRWTYSLYTWKGRVKLDPAIKGTLYFAAVVLASYENY